MTFALVGAFLGMIVGAGMAQHRANAAVKTLLARLGKA